MPITLLLMYAIFLQTLHMQFWYSTVGENNIGEPKM